MDGGVNTQNVREYAPFHHPPDFSFDISLSREKVHVWAALCGDGSIIGPFFFDVTINADRYLNMINADVVPEMMVAFQYNIFNNVLFPNMWWFQDGAPAHRET